MAKIYDVLKKAYESGDRFIDKAGKSLTPADVDSLGRKSYLDDVKNGTVDLEETAYREYKVGYFEGYLPLENMMKVFTDFYPDSAEYDSEGGDAE